MLHLKHLGPWGHKFLTHLFKLSLQSADIASIWKRATLHPIPSSALASKSLSEGSLRLATFHHGFRKMRFTTSALLLLAQKLPVGFNQNKALLRTVATAIDFRHREPPKANVTNQCYRFTSQYHPMVVGISVL